MRKAPNNTTSDPNVMIDEFISGEHAPEAYKTRHFRARRQSIPICVYYLLRAAASPYVYIIQRGVSPLPSH